MSVILLYPTNKRSLTLRVFEEPYKPQSLVHIGGLQFSFFLFPFF
nr:MAG TPA: hypothetical protein [Caudoviricetes sp.]